MIAKVTGMRRSALASASRRRCRFSATVTRLGTAPSFATERRVQACRWRPAMSSGQGSDPLLDVLDEQLVRRGRCGLQLVEVVALDVQERALRRRGDRCGAQPAAGEGDLTSDVPGTELGDHLA